MAAKKKRQFSELEKALGYRFKDQALLARALTHASMRSGGARGDNERLEFLGDRVLGLAIAEMLLKSHPASNEGDLARRFNRLVKGETCAVVGRGIGLGQYMILSDSESGSGGREKETILADAVEALLGAVFDEAGFDKARAVVDNLWKGVVQASPATASASADPKSTLQEWAQSRGLSLPRYVEISRVGPDHAPHFISEVRITGCKPAQGEGASKRAAEQAAASAMLMREGVALDAVYHAV